jgi:hypothetical protein
MANWTNLKTDIHNIIYENTSGDISGDDLQGVLDSIIDTVGWNSTFKGVAVPSTPVTTPDGPQFYLAHENGVYANFGITITRTGLYVFEYRDGAWTSKTVYVDEEVAITPKLNDTYNITLINNVLTFEAEGFTLLVGNRNYFISGDEDYTFSRVGATRGFLYFDLDKVKGKYAGYVVNWTTNNPFVVTTEAPGVGNYYLIASYYTTDMFINDTQLSYSLNYKAITTGLNFPNQNKIYQQFGTLFCSAFPQVYITVDTSANLITIPIGFSVIGLSSKTRYTTVASQTCSVIPVNLSGTPQTSTMGILLFNTTDLTFTNLLHSETQPANTLVVGIVRRTELSATKTGDVYIWGLEQYKVDGVLKGSSNNIIDRNRDIENLVLAAIAPKNGVQRYTFAQISDIHGQIESITNLASYTNNYTFSAIYQCGDLLASEIAEPIPSEILAAIDKLTDAYYPVVGNHDKGNGFSISDNYNNKELYDNYIEPFETQDGARRIYPAGTDLSYYFIDNATYKIRTFFLNEFDNDYINPADPTNYAVSRGYRCFSQAQINWFCDKLNTTPSSYHVAVVLHQAPFYLDSTSFVRSSFSYQGTVTYEPNKAYNGWMLPQIMNAYLNKINLSSSPLRFGFTHGSAGFKASSETWLNDHYTVIINKDFSAPTNANPKFIGYFCGHSHLDLVGFFTDAGGQIPVLSPKQAIIAVTTANYGVYSRHDDLPRVYGTKSQDAFNVCSVDTANDRLYVVRVGSNTGSNLTERKCTILNYGRGKIETLSLMDFDNNEQSATAEALNELNARIQALETFISNSVYDTIQVDNLHVVENLNMYKESNMLIKGTTAPSIEPDFIGQQYIDTVAGITYEAKGNSSVADWKQTSN